MNRFSLWLLGCVAAAGLFAASANAIELINDPQFQAGYDVYNQGVYQGQMQYTTANGAPKWKLGELYTKGTIYGATPTTLASGATKWENNYKSVVLGPTGTSDADAQLGVNSGAEYNGIYRSQIQPWPHLIANQEISTPQGWLASAAPSIADMTSVNFNIDVNLTQSDNIYNYYAGYSTNIHAAQFNNYFTIQNLNRSSPGFGNDYLWFAVSIYDDRNAVTTSGIMRDRATGQVIYSLGLSTLGKTEGPQVGEWMNITGDLLPYIKDALQKAWGVGSLTASTDFNDYYIGSEFLGWEVSGLSNVNMQVKNLSVNALVPEPSTFAMLAAGLVGLLGYVWRKRRR